jgi:hypothetical protein
LSHENGYSFTLPNPFLPTIVLHASLPESSLVLTTTSYPCLHAASCRHLLLLIVTQKIAL